MSTDADPGEDPNEITPLVRNSVRSSRRAANVDSGSALNRTKTILKQARKRFGTQNNEEKTESALDKVCSELEEIEKKGNRFFWIALFFIVNHVLGGAITMHFLEGWGFYDCAYFCIVTTTTVGYGDMTPKGVWSKIYVIYYVVVSIGLISTMLAYLIGLLIDQQEEMILSAFTRDRQADVEDLDDENVDTNELRLNMQNDEVTERIREATRRLDKSDWYNLFMAVMSLIVVLVIGFLVFYCLEGLSVLNAIYATTISASTVGFGDYEPTHKLTKAIMTVWLCFSTFAVGKVIADFTDASVKAKQRDVSRRLLTASMDMGGLQMFDMNRDGRVDKGEFLAEMLVRSGKVERDEVNAILLRFKQLDKDNSGEISIADLSSS